jgi:hypothetical protein
MEGAASAQAGTTCKVANTGGMVLTADNVLAGERNVLNSSDGHTQRWFHSLRYSVLLQVAAWRLGEEEVSGGLDGRRDGVRCISYYRSNTIYDGLCERLKSRFKKGGKGVVNEGGAFGSLQSLFGAASKAPQSASLTSPISFCCTRFSSGSSHARPRRQWPCQEGGRREWTLVHTKLEELTNCVA